MTDQRWWPTVAEIADDVRDGLAVGDEGRAVRLLMDGINRLPQAAEQGRLAEALAVPESVGDERWDALLAGAVRYRLHSLGLNPPPWTLHEPLSRFWWPFAHSPSKAYNDLAHTPAEFLRLGIFIDEREFTTA